MGILQLAHGAERDVYHAVYFVISLLHFGAQNTDDFETEAVNPDVLSQRTASGKQFFLRFRTDHRYAGALDLVFGVVETTLPEFEGANIKHVGIIAGDRPGKNPGVVLDACLLADFGRDMSDLGKVGGKSLYIILGKADEDSRLLPTRLHGSTARHYDDELGAEIGKDVGASPAKTVAISEQHDHRRNAPSHAQHSEGGAAAIVPHGAVGFVEHIPEHRITPAAGLPPAATWPLFARGKDLPPLRPQSGCQSRARPTWAPIWADQIRPARAPFPPLPSTMSPDPCRSD